MKSWEDLEPDVYVLMNKHFTAGRDRKIDKIVIHYNAGVNLSTEDCWRIWQSREASAHYQVETSGRIGQLVRDRDTAWHAGSWAANGSSIGIEHANNSAAFGFSDATLENGAHLVAALCKGYNLGRPQWGVNVFPHNDFSATSCPGSLDGSGSYIRRAQEWYDSMMGGKPVTPTAPAKPASSNKPKKLDVDEYFGRKMADALAYINNTPRDGGTISSQDAWWRSQYEDRFTSVQWVSSDDAEGSLLIIAIQKFLKRVGHYRGDIDGLIGPKFVAAFIAYYGGGTLAAAIGNCQRAINKQLGY